MLLVELPLFARSGLGVGIGVNTLMSSGFKKLTIQNSHLVMIGIWGINDSTSSCLQVSTMLISCHQSLDNPQLSCL